MVDLLLATPAVDGPIALQLTEVKGPIASPRPCVRYEFADPRLEALTAGQKIMLRVGPVNERRLKVRLAAFRQAAAAGRGCAQRHEGRQPPLTAVGSGIQTN